jgi:hypothetical protein
LHSAGSAAAFGIEIKPAASNTTPAPTVARTPPLLQGVSWVPAAFPLSGRHNDPPVAVVLPSSVMRVAPGLRTVAAMAAAAIAVAPMAPAAHASDGDWGLNGTYTATSNGEWAKTNEIFHDEASIRSTWTISTVCSYPTECTGTVSSDQGWTAPIYQKSGVWYVKRTVDNWEPCPGGAAVQGLQIFRFAATTPDGSQADPASSTLVGEDQTTGPSGACGISKPLLIDMPFKLVMIG